jgi:hypothetical protein
LKTSTFFIGAALLLFGCTKNTDTYNTDTESQLSKNLAKGIKKCALTKITTHDPYNEDVIATITYTDKGQPHTITYNVPPSTGFPAYEFVYDKNHKLSQFLEVYSGGRSNYEAWHIYQYGQKGLIVSDTTYFWGGLQPGMTHPRQADNIDIFVHTYTYDKQRRISSVSQRSLPTPYNQGEDTTTITYTYYHYNEAGNLGDNYSDALNINQTSPVFMFVNHDYSINSPIRPAEVNATGLPTKYTSPEGSYGNSFLVLNLSNAEIEYSCDTVAMGWKEK